MDSESYKKLGASSSKSGMLCALELPATSRFFAEPLADVCGDNSYYSVLHADGAGTKSIVAYLAYRESGDKSWFKSLAQDSLVMNLDDVACLGAFESLLLSNTIGRNRHLVPDEVVGEIVNGYRDYAIKLKSVGIDIRLAGGETADMGDAIRTLVVDSTLFARVRKEHAIDTSRITAGDIIIGFSGTGRASYEDHENSGIGSNGLTLARHALIHRKYVERYPEIVDPSLKKDGTYNGRCDLFAKPEGMSHTVAEALLSPTRTYAPIISRVREILGNDLHGAIHCSGGGQTKIIRFGSGKHYIKDNLFPAPPIFLEIQRTLSLKWREMYSVFNMGHRVEIICPERHLDIVIKAANSFGIEAKKVGFVQDAQDRNQITIKSREGVFEY